MQVDVSFFALSESVALIFVTVFYLHEGATLQNVIIGANQAEGVRTSFLVCFHWAFSQPLSCTRLYWMYVFFPSYRFLIWSKPP